MAKSIIYDNNLDFVDSLLRAFNEDNMCFISMQYSEKNIENKWLGGENFEEIFELVKKSIETDNIPVILYDTGRFFRLIENKKFQEIFYTYKRTSFFKTPFLLKDVRNEIEKLNSFSNEKDELFLETSKLQIEHSAIRIWIHDLYYRPEIVNDINNTFKTNFDPEKDVEAVKEFLRSCDSSYTIKGRHFEGRRLKGVFCDIEGTLTGLEGNINSEIFKKLKDFEKDNFITLWTGGDWNKLRIELAKKNILWKVLPKELFAGARVEIAIDDRDKESIKKEFNIDIETFISAKSN